VLINTGQKAPIKMMNVDAALNVEKYGNGIRNIHYGSIGPKTFVSGFTAL